MGTFKLFMLWLIILSVLYTIFDRVFTYTLWGWNWKALFGWYVIGPIAGIIFLYLRHRSIEKQLGYTPIRFIERAPVPDQQRSPPQGERSPPEGERR